MSRRWHIILCTLMLTLAIPSAAWAEDLSVSELTERERADLGRLFAAAQRAFEQNAYERAIDSLEQAFAIFPEPNILYRIGDAYERQGQLGEAVKYYTRYVEAAADAEDVPLVHRHIVDLKSYLQKEAPTEAPPTPTAAKTAVLFIDSTPPGAQVYIADEPAPRAVTPARIRVAPGKAPILIKIDGYAPLERVLRVESGETLSMVYPLQKLPEAPATKAAAAEGSSAWPWVLTGVGTASLATGAILLVAAQSAGSQLDTYDQQRLNAHQNATPVPTRPANYDSLTSNAYYFSRTGWAMVGVGAVGVGAGIAWLMLSDDDDAEVAVVPSWGGMSLMGRF